MAKIKSIKVTTVKEGDIFELYEFDKSGLLTHRISDGGDLEEWFKWLIEGKVSGVTKSICHFHDTDTEDNISENCDTIHIYDKGVIICEITHDVDCMNDKTYEYDERGNLVKTMDSSCECETTTYEYDDNDNMIHSHTNVQSVKINDGKVEQNIESLDIWYKYDSDGNIISCTRSDGKETYPHEFVENSDTRGPKLCIRTIEYYDDDET